ncbi:uncharacterized protein V1518DRAFT_427046 [Limtongia smithiae]|uniref:uncharacterized protein n=1 Tax=Limtongia smithiae TaxID=1125753 RepID=UPI0034CD56FB
MDSDASPGTAPPSLRAAQVAAIALPAAAPAPPAKPDKPRPHICTICLRAFARLEHLKRHERSHTKEKPFECPVCERRFARRDLLLRHQQKLHTGLPTTRQRQPRKNSITIATLGRPRKESLLPPARPRANSFSGTSADPLLDQSALLAAQQINDPVSYQLGEFFFHSHDAAGGSTNPADFDPHDLSASTNSWLESTFGKGIGAYGPGEELSTPVDPATGSSTSSAATPANATADSIRANLFGSLYINPDLLPFSLPDNESMGLTLDDEDAIDIDQDFWLSSLSISSPTATIPAASAAPQGPSAHRVQATTSTASSGSVHSGLADPASSVSTGPSFSSLVGFDDSASPNSYGTPLSTSSAGSAQDYVKNEPAGMNFSFMFSSPQQQHSMLQNQFKSDVMLF